MKRTPTTSVSKLMSLFTLLERSNISVKSFLRDAGLDEETAAYPDRRVPLDVVSNLNLRAVELTGDEFIGLHQGEVFTGFSNILGYVLMNCRDVAEAIEKYAKYQQILDEGRVLLYRADGETVVMQYMIDHPFLRNDRHLVEHMMAGMLTYSRNLTGADLQCSEVTFAHAAPTDIGEYQRLFKCTPQFNSEMNTLVFDSAYLQLPILQPNRELLVVLERYAREVLARLRQDDSHAGRARRMIVDVLRGAAPSIRMIASKMNMSVRNLQMKLREEGTTYSELLAEGRRELAQEYLRDQNVPIEEITYLLGFSEPSVFHRTFKRWTGITPGVFRKHTCHTQENMR
jgi:AraC-like DNA-binding protein